MAKTREEKIEVIINKANHWNLSALIEAVKQEYRSILEDLSDDQIDYQYYELLKKEFEGELENG